MHYAERSQSQLVEFGRQQQEELQQVVGLQAVAFRLQELLQALGDEQARLEQAVQRGQVSAPAQSGDAQGVPPGHQVDKAALDERLKGLQAAFEAFRALPHAVKHEAQVQALQKRFASLLENGLRPQLQELVRRNPAVASHHGQSARMHGAPFLLDLERLGQALASGRPMPQAGFTWIEAAIEWAIYAALFVSMLTVAIVLWGSRPT
ncbi:hypothetical protein ACE0DR_05430 [Azotobacter sp. CWF10]